ncbi:MAG: hypothetical protein R6W75_04330 [Smithellaceae bacterium]
MMRKGDNILLAKDCLREVIVLNLSNTYAFEKLTELMEQGG